MFSATVSGHSPQRERLHNLFCRKKLPATMAFSGPAGIGKLLVAKELCRSIFCSCTEDPSGTKDLKSLPYGGCGECRNCRQFDSGSFPDFHLVDCADREGASIASVRALLHSLNLKSYSGSPRAVIFDNAELLSVQAANALLKSLEEPRPDTYFILVTSNHAKLTPTLISRCQVWFFDHLKPEELKSILASRYSADTTDKAQLDQIALLADGSLSEIDAIMQNISAWEDLKSRLDALSYGGVVEALELVKDLAREKDELRQTLKHIAIYARHRMYTGTGAVEQRKWSALLVNSLSAMRLIYERNLSAQYVLTASILDFVSPPSLEAFTGCKSGVTLVDKIVV